MQSKYRNGACRRIHARCIVSWCFALNSLLNSALTRALGRSHCSGRHAHTTETLCTTPSCKTTISLSCQWTRADFSDAPVYEAPAHGYTVHLQVPPGSRGSNTTEVPLYLQVRFSKNFYPQVTLQHVRTSREGHLVF